MSEIFNQTQFIFNTTGQISSTTKPFQLFSDQNGTILNKNNIEYGVYNKILDFEFKKVLMIKKHSIGLGDIVDWLTKITKIKDLIIYLTKGNCGCEQRRILFNKWVRFNWFSVKFREIYAADSYIIKYQKHLLKEIIPIEMSENQKMNNIKNKILTHNPSYNLPDSSDPPIKRSCGCGAKS